MAFTANLFISIGATNALFTLRQTYVHEYHLRNGTVCREVRSFHLQNLSNDLDLAIEKAIVISLTTDIPLRADEKSLIERELRDITRANKEERERRAKEAEEREIRWKAERAAREVSLRHDLLQGLVSFGKYKGYRIENLPLGYIQWVSECDTFEVDSLMEVLRTEINTRYTHLLLPKPDPLKTVGEVGERLSIEATIIRISGYHRQAYMRFGVTEWVSITTLVDANGVCYVIKSVSFSPDRNDLGKVIKLKGTVKEHDEYNGQCQTVLERPALVKEKVAA
jgi:uncharacterized protein (DUF3820 family)